MLELKSNNSWYLFLSDMEKLDNIHPGEVLLAKF